MTRDSADLWVFAYGSLMWRPGFDFSQVVRARVQGFRRSFCVYSTHHRGSPERPGLVLGLDRGGACEGVAYRIGAEQARETVGYLRARELVNGVYREMTVPIALGDGAAREQHLAVAYVVERQHPTYTGRLPLIEQSRLIRRAEGLSGANIDYLVNTVNHLRELGIRERELERLLTLTAPHLSERGGSNGAPSAGARALMRACRHIGIAAPRLKLEQERRFLYRQRVGAMPS